MKKKNKRIILEIIFSKDLNKTLIISSMISPEKIKEVREHLETAQNPIFFFDNDADGLCSFYF